MRHTSRVGMGGRPAVVLVLAASIALGGGLWLRFGGGSPQASGAGATALGSRIASIAEGQVGYHSAPAGTQCNPFSAYWGVGEGCGNGMRSESWCADFAAWTWKRAGASVTYGPRDGELNAGAISFYRWGLAHGTWHAAGSGYAPEPGDVAIYGIDPTASTAQHLAVVTAYTPGNRGPDAVNGDGMLTGYSVVEARADEYRADIAGPAGQLSGYVSPST